MAPKEAYLTTELDCVRGAISSNSSLAAMIEDYFEGHVEPVEVASAGAGEDYTGWLSGSRFSKLVELTLCSVMYAMCK